jgi:hypothetical protein
LAVSLQSSAQSHFFGRLEPNRVGQKRHECISRRRDAFHNDKIAWPELDPLGIVCCVPLRRLKADRFVARNRFEDLLNYLRPPVRIDGLWGLRFAPATPGAAPNTLFFTAGLNHEADGLFGTLSPNG